jgi:putative FmdB family regulatory protein
LQCILGGHILQRQPCESLHFGARPRMPIYEYECEACGHTLDALQKLSDPLLTECPACGKATLRKRISAPRFRLKGGGWYETDFKQGNRRNIAESGEGSGAAKSTTSKTGADSAAGSSKSDGTGSSKSTGDSAGSTAKPTAPSSDA